MAAGAEPEALKHTTVVCGCGGGDAVRAALPKLLAHCARLVLDADALNLVSADEMLRQQLRLRASRGLATLITPHPLEAARLLGCGSAEVQSDRLRAAHELAVAMDCVVVLKGSGTVLAAPGRTARINASGNASLATAGTGDVLAGWLGGHWAQRNEADPLERAWQAAIHGVWLHGFAADEAALPVLRAGDLIERMAAMRGALTRLSAVCCCAALPKPCAPSPWRRVPGAPQPPLPVRDWVFVAALAARSAALILASSSPACACGTRSRRVRRRAASSSPSRTMRKSILRPSRSTRLTCTRTRAPTM